MDNIVGYFSNEKLQCSIGISLGLLSLALSVYFIYLDKVVFKGIAYAFIPLSQLLLAICVGVVLRTPKDIKRVAILKVSQIKYKQKKYLVWRK